MSAEPVRGDLVETEAPSPSADETVLSQREQVWVRHQHRTQTSERSKYVPHQGARERARRLAKQGAA